MLFLFSFLAFDGFMKTLGKEPQKIVKANLEFDKYIMLRDGTIIGLKIK